MSELAIYLPLPRGGEGRGEGQTFFFDSDPSSTRVRPLSPTLSPTLSPKGERETGTR
jgi:hypothetical protein